MSWSLSKEATGEDLVAFGLNEQDASAVEQQNTDAGSIVGAVFESVLDILQDGAVGSLDKRYRVELSGHVNPHHEPRKDWSNDYVLIRIVQQ